MLTKVSIILCLFFLPCTVAYSEDVRTYELYEPSITYSTVYSPGFYLYNHCASVEYFDGLFYVVWNSNTASAEGEERQRLFLSTSTDFVNWSAPVHFVGTSAGAINPQDWGIGQRQWQPNLMNYNGQQLWCMWYQSNSLDGSKTGLYLSTLNSSGGFWTNKEILYRATMLGNPTTPFSGQNPVMLSTGRVLAPLTFSSNGIDLPFNQHPRYNAIAYTDDAGLTWGISNIFTAPESLAGQWEVTVCEKPDGTIRIFHSNRVAGGLPIPIPTERLFTCSATGINPGEPVVTEPDSQYSSIETIASRPYVRKLSTDRYMMLHHDIWTEVNSYEARQNIAMFFSRTAEDDFVAGPGIQPKGEVGAYPQAMEHEGKIYIVYSNGGAYVNRDITGVVVDPAPSADQFYIWPRTKDVIQMEYSTTTGWVRTNPDYEYTKPYLTYADSRSAICFEKRGSAGVEIDRLDYNQQKSLKLSFDAKISQVQEFGSLILCSFGDKWPVRLGVPGDRAGSLYVETGKGWEYCGAMPLNEWNNIEISFAATKVKVKVGDGPEKVFESPVNCPNPRLYLGDGYELEYFLPETVHMRSNEQSVFYIDIDSVNTVIENNDYFQIQVDQDYSAPKSWPVIYADVPYKTFHGLGSEAVHLSFDGDSASDPANPLESAWANRGRAGYGETPATIGTGGQGYPAISHDGLNDFAYDGSPFQQNTSAMSYAYGRPTKALTTDIETVLSNLWSYTATLWFNAGTGGSLGDNGAYLLNTPVLGVRYYSDHLSVRIGRLGTWLNTGSLSISDGWVFMAVTYDGSVPFDGQGVATQDNVNIYVGTADSELTWVAALKAAPNEGTYGGWLVRDIDGAMLTIGNESSNGARPWRGLIDELRIWSSGAELSTGPSIPLAILDIGQIEEVRENDLRRTHYYGLGDLNLDERVDMLDFSILAEKWLQ
jgi:hypothetical protein